MGDKIHSQKGNSQMCIRDRVNGQPKVLNLKQILYHYVQHQKDVVTRRTKFELNKAEARAHILEGLRIALDLSLIHI